METSRVLIGETAQTGLIGLGPRRGRPKDGVAGRRRGTCVSSANVVLHVGLLHAGVVTDAAAQ